MLNFSFSKVLSFLSFSSFLSLTFFQHAHDLKINMFLSLIQTELIAEKSNPLVQVVLRQVRFYTSCKIFEQNVTEVKHRRQNYVFQLVVSCLYNHHAILQFKELQFIYTS